MDHACQALSALPLTSTPCLGVVQVQLRAARNLCESWIEWWDEIQDLPMEASRPEPRLEGLLGLPVARPGTLPPYAPLVHSTCDELAQHHNTWMTGLVSKWIDHLAYLAKSPNLSYKSANLSCKSAN